MSRYFEDFTILRHITLRHVIISLRRRFIIFVENRETNYKEQNDKQVL